MRDCPYRNECVNVNKLCYKCFNYNMLKYPKAYKTLQPKSPHKKEKKMGIDFEKRGTQKYNQAVHQAKDIARRQVASGALSFALGDMITEEELTAALAEFKERSNTDKSGHKQITIKKAWLDKLKEEAKEMHRDFYFLPFSFKGSDVDYVAMEYDMLLSYVQMIQVLHEENRLLKQQINNQ